MTDHNRVFRCRVCSNILEGAELLTDDGPERAEEMWEIYVGTANDADAREIQCDDCGTIHTIYPP